MEATILRTCLRGARSAAVVVAGVGLCGLLGWVFDNQTLKGIFPRGVTIKPNAAIGLGLAGLALWVLRDARRTPWLVLGRLAAVLTALIGGLTLTEHVTGRDLGIDQLLFTEPPGQPGTMSPGRMGPPASLALLLAGGSLLLLRPPGRAQPATFQVFAVLIVVIAAIPLIGYAHQVNDLYRLAKYTGIALHTAVALLALGLGILLARPAVGLTAAFCRDDAGGLLARRLVLPALLLPFLAGWIRWLADAAGLLDPAVTRALFVVFLTTCALLLILLYARRLSELDRQRSRSLAREQFLNDLNDHLMSLGRPLAIMTAAIERTGQQLGAARCFLAEWPEGGAEARIMSWERPGASSMPSRQLVSTLFPPSLWAQRGPTGAISHLQSEPALHDLAQHYLSLNVQSLAYHRLDLSDDRRFCLVAAQEQPRDWLPDEVDLLEAVADRVWPLVQRARAELGLRTSEARLRAVTENAPVLLANLDRDLRYVFVNTRYARRFGRSVREVVGKPVGDVVGDAFFHKIVGPLKQALGGRRVEFEVELEDPSTGVRWLHAICTPEESAEGEVMGVVAVITDVTDRKRAERDIELARDQALAASSAKDAFIAMLSHELRTPLSPVLLIASEGTENPELPESARRDFNTIRNHVEQEARLIDDLLDLSRITRGKLALNLEAMDAKRILADSLRAIEGDARGHGLTLQVSLPEQPVMMHGDAMRLQQVVWNVLKNAIKFTPPGGRIQLTADRPQPEQLLIEVTDTGIGMTQEEIDRVFEPFVQGEHAAQVHQNAFGGLGLGLAISRLLVELHDGSISARSAGRGHGTTVSILLPVRESIPPPSTRAEGPGRILTGWPAGLRLLVVEDHTASRIALVSLLKRRQCVVHEACGVSEALELARKEPFDLVISDLGLPDGHGCDLMAALKREHGLHGIALTGYGMEEDIVRTRAAGFVAHLTKPINVRAMDRAVTDALAQPGASPPLAQSGSALPS